jgi:hypothetical protein
MSSMPLRIDDDLIKEARVSGQVFHRSIVQQVEHWASLGRVLEKVLTISSVAKVKGLHWTGDLDTALASARSTAGRKKTLALLARKKGSLYGAKPDHQGILLQHRPDGTTVAGEMVSGEFVPNRKAAQKRAR